MVDWERTASLRIIYKNVKVAFRELIDIPEKGLDGVFFRDIGLEAMDAGRKKMIFRLPW